VPTTSLAAVSCRKKHRESGFGAFVPPLDNNGKPVKRTGWMVHRPAGELALRYVAVTLRRT
jgi:hypothetical protein